MLYSEKVLIKLLEYGKMTNYNVYKSIASILGLEFYNEPDESVFSICSEAFVLDVTNKSSTLIFVDEELNKDEYKFIEKYFNQYLDDKKTFYYLLKFFTKVIDLENISSAKNKISENILLEAHGDLKECKTICSCIFGKNYCYKEKIKLLPGYNIFTHRYDKIYNDPFLVLENNKNSREIEEYQLENNLSLYFKEKDFTVDLIKKLSLDKPHYYENNNYRVNGRNIYIDNQKNKFASFLFKKGLSLEESIKYWKNIEKYISEE